MTQTSDSKKKSRRAVPMRAKIFIYFAAFSLFTILILWIFQTVLLDDIYSAIKIRTLRASTDAIARLYDGKSDAAINDTAQKKNICVSVYTVTDSTARLVSEAHVDTNCILHNIASSSNTILNLMYDGAKQTDCYIRKFAIEPGKGVVIPNDSIASGEMTSVICAKIAQTENGTYFILLNTEMIPVNATVETLRAQLVIITIILIAVAAVLAFVLSSRASKPVVAMSREAVKLAAGNYDVYFPDDTSFYETNELGTTLNYAASELSQLDRMQKELIANISHDLRTPLTMISGYTEVMRDIPGENTPENMQVIIDETKRLSSLVNDMLELSRLTGGQGKLTLTTFDITDMISSILKRYSRLKERDGYTINFEYDRHAIVSADETKITQVIYNLVNNAINYTGDDKLVTVRQSVNDDKVRIEVIDTGDGIPEEKLPMIWERYYRAGDFHKRPVIGTGLGLAIVKNCLVMHEARFGVSSTVGKGSTFWFELDELKPDTEEKAKR